MLRSLLIVMLSFVVVPLVTAEETDIPRRPSGVPDLSGTYDAATLTPLTRPREFGDRQFMTREEADEIARAEAEVIAKGLEASDPNREAPAAGGAAPVGADASQKEALGAGSVGGYNNFWIDRGSGTFEIDGKVRTSIIYEPANGQQPMMTPKGMKKMADNFSSFTHVNDGTAWWYDQPGHGPFDGPEDVALAERCLLGFSAGPPMLPGLYNNYKRIIQTDTHVTILLEMVHDARIIRLDSEHQNDDQVDFWLGESVGHWEGDELVVETRNFREDTGLYGGDANLKLVERFERLADGNLRYDFTVDDPTAWREKWSGEYLWKSEPTSKVYEYACHEGNYAMPGILRGARLLEKEAAEGKSATDD